MNRTVKKIVVAMERVLTEDGISLTMGADEARALIASWRERGKALKWIGDYDEDCMDSEDGYKVVLRARDALNAKHETKPPPPKQPIK